MVKRGSHYICMFMIYLLIMPVLHSADVFAYFSAGVHGHDGIPNFRRATSDVTIINANASAGEQGFDEAQVKLLSDPTRRFDCGFDDASGLHHCELVIPGSLPPGPHDYEVQLFDSDLNEAEPKQVVTVVADALPPDILSFDVEQDGSDVYAVFSLADRVCELCSPQVCSGVARVDILLDHKKVGEFFPEAGACAVPVNSTLLDIPDLQGTVTRTVCLDAYDRLGQRSSECMDVVMDFSGPDIINASLWKGDEMLRFTKGEPISDVTLKAYIEEDSGLDTDTLAADLSSLNAREEFSEIYGDIGMSGLDIQRFDPSCIEESDGTYLCTWKNLLLYLPEGFSAEIGLSVHDSFGNVMDENYLFPFVFDSTKPMVTGARTGIADDEGRYWVGKGNNTVYIDIEEEVSGFNEGKLFLDFSSFGPQPFADKKEVLGPNWCSQGWTCRFDNVNVVKEYSSGTVLPVNVAAGSSDDAGNAVSGATNLGFYYDGEPPEIISVENSSVCPSAPDDIEITVTVSELYSGKVEAEVSAPDLSAAAFPMKVPCEETETGGIWTCDVLIGNLFTYYSDGVVNLTLVDRAGNSRTTTLYQEVCEAAPGVPPNVVSSVRRVKLFPAEGIDRMVAEKIPFPLFWQPDPEFRSGNAEIQDIKVDNCSVNGGSVSDSYIVTPLDMESPMFSTKVSLSPESLTVENESEMLDFVTMDCQLSMTVRSGTKVYQQAEIENVVFEVPLHGTVLGELDESLQDKLESIEESIEDVEGDIESLQKFVKIAGWFCSVSEMVMKIVAALQVLKTALYAVGWAIALVVAIWSGLDTGMKTGGVAYFIPCSVIDILTTSLITNLWQVDSRVWVAWDSPGYLPKAFCAYFTCRLTETSSFIELVGHIGRTNSGTYSGHVDDVVEEGDRNYLEREDINEEVDAGDAWQTVVWAGDNSFSAYRSYPIAKALNCGPAELYGKKKERQILCMYRNCYKDMVSAGYSPEICDRMYAGRECLYVDGAAYRAVDGAVAQRILAGALEYVMNLAAASALSFASREAGCPYPVGWSLLPEMWWESGEKCGGQVDTALAKGWQALLCGNLIMTTIWIDIGDWLDYDDFRNTYADSLGDPDYCMMGEE